MHGRDRKRGLTLMEVLTVIVVLLLLVMIFLPTITRSLDMARKVICYSNMRHIGESLISYTGDNRMNMVPAAMAQFGAFQPQPEMWPGILIHAGYASIQPINASNYRTAPPYTKSFFYCPAGALDLHMQYSDVSADPFWFVPFAGARFPDNGGANVAYGKWADCWYGINNTGATSTSVALQLTGSDMATGNRGPFRRMIDYTKPTRTVIIYDGIYQHLDMNYVRNNVHINGAERIQCRHLGRTVDNLLFVDGHAESALDTLIPTYGPDFGNSTVLRANWNSFIWRLDQ